MNYAVGGTVIRRIIPVIQKFVPVIVLYLISVNLIMNVSLQKKEDIYTPGEAKCNERGRPPKWRRVVIHGLDRDK